jgi:hypothetical protein
MIVEKTTDMAIDKKEDEKKEKKEGDNNNDGDDDNDAEKKPEVKVPEPKFEELENPARVTKQQWQFISFDVDQRYLKKKNSNRFFFTNFHIVIFFVDIHQSLRIVMWLVYVQSLC